MLPDYIKETLLEVRKMLLRRQSELREVQSQKQHADGTSVVMKADILAEQMLVPALCKLWPDVPVLCEEANTSQIPELVPGIQLLPHEDSYRDLPETFISVDGLDGSALYANGKYELVGISVGLIKNTQPTIGIVMMLDKEDIFHCGFSDSPGVLKNESPLERFPQNSLKGSLICIDDNKSVGMNWRTQVLNTLTSSYGTRYPLNQPSVAGAMDVLRGHCAAYTTSNARNWDIAGVTALCKSAGLIVEELGARNGPLWRCVRMPPVVFARDKEAFEYVNSIATSSISL